MKVPNSRGSEKLSENSLFGTTSKADTNSSLKREKLPDWWPFRWDPSACSSSSAKGIGSGIMKKEDIKL